LIVPVIKDAVYSNQVPQFLDELDRREKGVKRKRHFELRLYTMEVMIGVASCHVPKDRLPRELGGGYSQIGVEGKPNQLLDFIV
jgi:hypothetical protein